MHIRQQLKNRINVIADLNEGVRYSYRLKSLAAIRITTYEATILWDYAIKNGIAESSRDYGVLTKFNNRPVEIIEEDI